LIKKNLKSTVQVFRLFYFLLLSRFFQKKKSGFLVRFIVFFKWEFLKNPGGFFWVGFFYNNPAFNIFNHILSNMLPTFS